MEILLKSLVSAAITAMILIIAKFAGPRLAGAIGGMPVIFVISYVILTMNDKSISKEFLLGGIYGAIASIFFCLLLIWLNIHFLKTHWINFIIAYIVCFFFTLSLVYLTKK